MLASASTCGDFSSTKGPDRCVYDSECSEEASCFRGTCEPRCDGGRECEAGLSCLSEARPATDDVVEVCVTELPPPTDVQCGNDNDCHVAFPDTTAQCGTDGICYVPAFSLLIRDTTVTAPDIDDAPGADIAAVFLVDPTTNQPIAWADTIAHVDNVSGVDNLPDGAPRDIDEDLACVTGTFETATTSLGGEGGYLLVRFLEYGGASPDSSTAAVVTSLPSTWNVVVVEWGDNCGATGDPDSYEVLACAARTHRGTVPDRDCGELLGAAEQGGVLRISASQN